MIIDWFYFQADIYPNRSLVEIFSRELQREVNTFGAKYARGKYLMHLARKLLINSERNIVRMLGQSKISSFFTASSQKRTHSDDDNAANVSCVKLALYRPQWSSNF